MLLESLFFLDSIEYSDIGFCREEMFLLSFLSHFVQGAGAFEVAAKKHLIDNVKKTVKGVIALNH